MEAKFLVGSQVEARALRGHRGLPAGQSGGGWEGARPAGAGPVLAPQGSAHVRRAGWGPEPAPPGSPTAMERLTLPAGSAAAVDEYMEYRR